MVTSLFGNYCMIRMKQSVFLNKFFVSLHIMFECHRKYQKICIVLIMSIFVICIFADEFDDMRQFGNKNNPVACMSIAEEDVDFDEEGDYLPDICPYQPGVIPMEEFTYTDLKTSARNQSKALLMGQVRRHFPRGCRKYGQYCTVFDNGSSGVGFPMPLFLCERNQSVSNKIILL